ncbi:uncharacterized protein LOC116253467 [Nymphaea colorata]|uniref:uncharacterized protein LOC116253467 n=1 Tax=Nymphaea colorata TaxID=210225 RepID=UPI00214E4C81|nr:uncharacterized protein LOC116253467 [Nymphaea colorata]
MRQPQSIYVQELSFFHTLETTMESPKALTNTKFLFSLKSLSLFLLSLMFVSHVFDAPTLSISVVLSPEDRSVLKFFGSKVGQVLCRFAAREATYILALGTASLFSATVTIYSAITASAKEKHLTLNDLSWRILGTWMKLIITWVYITLIAISFALFMVLFICYSTTAFEDIVLHMVVLLLVVFSSMYFIVVQIMGSIIEILEEDCSEPNSPLAEEEFLLLKMEEGCDNDKQNCDMLNDSRGSDCDHHCEHLLVSFCGALDFHGVRRAVLGLEES